MHATGRTGAAVPGTQPRQRRLLIALLTTMLALAGLTSAQQPAAATPTGFTVSSDGRILDAYGNDFVIRGVSFPHAWYRQHTATGLPGIASHGANAVRVVLGSGQRWGPTTSADITNIVELCKANRLVCVLEVHDTTGYGEQNGAATLDQAVDYWISIQDALVGEEAHVIINIGNEPMGNDPAVNATWASTTADAIVRLRDAGFDHMLMVDAPNWGQDWTWTMFDQAPEVFAADPHGNTVFSIHMYGVYEQAERVTQYLEGFVERGLPLVIGEFGFDHSDGNPDEDAIMAEARRLGLGYIGWSWSGNGNPVQYLDMVTRFNPDQLTWWGERIFYGPDGIAETAQPATTYTQPASATECRDGGWRSFDQPAFSNLGRCISLVQTRWTSSQHQR